MMRSEASLDNAAGMMISPCCSTFEAARWWVVELELGDMPASLFLQTVYRLPCLLVDLTQHLDVKMANNVIWYFGIRGTDART
jgi:hypothetical protein